MSTPLAPLFDLGDMDARRTAMVHILGAVEVAMVTAGRLDPDGFDAIVTEGVAYARRWMTTATEVGQ